MSALLDEVLDAHGGLERWRTARTVHARVRAGGLLIRMRVPGNRFADYRITVHVQKARTVLDPFPHDGQRGVFESGAARIESHEGEVISSRANARAAFFGRSGLRRNIRWDPLDSVYFAGYAMWNYLTTPYVLTREDVEVGEGETWQEGGETWRRLNASFPSDIDTHSSGQTFYFDAGGRLRRHDYVPEVIWPLGTGRSLLRRPRSRRRARVPNSPVGPPDWSWQSLAALPDSGVAAADRRAGRDRIGFAIVHRS